MVHGDEVEAVPRTLLHRDLVAERLHELIALGRAEGAELDHGALAANGSDLRGGGADEDRAIAVEVGLPLSQ